MSVNLKDPAELDYVIKEMQSHRAQRKPYKSFYPVQSLKGSIKKVHRTGLQTYARYIYVNPIEGLFVSYQSQQKFPHSPSYIIKLTEVKECGVLLEDKVKWFFKKG